MATDDRLDELLSQHDEVDLEPLLDSDSLDIDELLSDDGDELAALLDEVTDGD